MLPFTELLADRFSKVFVSFVIQSGISILFLSMLATYTPENFISKWIGQKHHTRAIISATTVEFQKAQCYFACAIQVAALIYILQVSNTWGTTSTYLNYQKFGLCLAISTIGTVPTIFTLTWLSSFHPRSRYLLLLPCCSYILSTSVFFYGMYVWNFDIYETYPLFAGQVFPACSFNSQGFSEVADPLLEGNYCLDLH
jgi:hypothetical protein